jgi:hypothetical protein
MLHTIHNASKKFQYLSDIIKNESDKFVNVLAFKSNSHIYMSVILFMDFTCNCYLHVIACYI